MFLIHYLQRFELNIESELCLTLCFDHVHLKTKSKQKSPLALNLEHIISYYIFLIQLYYTLQVHAWSKQFPKCSKDK